MANKYAKQPAQTETSVSGTTDCNGNPLHDGDMVILIKDLKLNGKEVWKQGTVVKKIHLTDDPALIKCEGGVYLKTEFLKRKN